MMTTIHAYTGDQRLLDSLIILIPNVFIGVFCMTKRICLVKEDVNHALEKASKEHLNGRLGYCELPLVFIDLNSDSLSSIVDAQCTDVINGNMVKTYSWYDNEAGYSN